MSNENISVILICHKRFRIFEDIIRFWLSQPKVTEVLIMDNSGTFKTDLDATVFSVNKNLGPGARIPIVQYAKNEKIITCDDDLELTDGIIEDLEKHWNENTITGIMGKFWDNQNYLKCKHIMGSGLSKPLEVDYVPYNLALFHRKWFTKYDLHQIPDHFYTDDLWLSLKWRQEGAKLLTIPSQNWKSSRENRDENAMHRRSDLIDMRQKYLKKWVFDGEPL